MSDSPEITKEQCLNAFPEFNNLDKRIVELEEQNSSLTNNSKRKKINTSNNTGTRKNPPCNTDDSDRKVTSLNEQLLNTNTNEERKKIINEFNLIKKDFPTIQFRKNKYMCIKKKSSDTITQNKNRKHNLDILLNGRKYSTLDKSEKQFIQNELKNINEFSDDNSEYILKGRKYKIINNRLTDESILQNVQTKKVPKIITTKKGTCDEADSAEVKRLNELISNATTKEEKNNVKLDQLNFPNIRQTYKTKKFYCLNEQLKEIIKHNKEILFQSFYPNKKYENLTDQMKKQLHDYSVNVTIGDITTIQAGEDLLYLPDDRKLVVSTYEIGDEHNEKLLLKLLKQHMQNNKNINDLIDKINQLGDESKYIDIEINSGDNNYNLRIALENNYILRKEADVDYHNRDFLFKEFAVKYSNKNIEEIINLINSLNVNNGEKMVQYEEKKYYVDNNKKLIKDPNVKNRRIQNLAILQNHAMVAEIRKLSENEKSKLRTFLNELENKKDGETVSYNGIQFQVKGNKLYLVDTNNMIIQSVKREKKEIIKKVDKINSHNKKILLKGAYGNRSENDLNADEKEELNDTINSIHMNKYTTITCNKFTVLIHPNKLIEQLTDDVRDRYNKEQLHKFFYGNHIYNGDDDDIINDINKFQIGRPKSVYYSITINETIDDIPYSFLIEIDPNNIIKAYGFNNRNFLNRQFLLQAFKSKYSTYEIEQVINEINERKKKNNGKNNKIFMVEINNEYYYLNDEYFLQNKAKCENEKDEQVRDKLNYQFVRANQERKKTIKSNNPNVQKGKNGFYCAKSYDEKEIERTRARRIANKKTLKASADLPLKLSKSMATKVEQFLDNVETTTDDTIQYDGIAFNIVNKEIHPQSEDVTNTNNSSLTRKKKVNNDCDSTTNELIAKYNKEDLENRKKINIRGNDYINRGRNSIFYCIDKKKSKIKQKNFITLSKKTTIYKKTIKDYTNKEKKEFKDKIQKQIDQAVSNGEKIITLGELSGLQIKVHKDGSIEIDKQNDSDPDESGENAIDEVSSDVDIGSDGKNSEYLRQNVKLYDSDDDENAE